MKLLIAVFLLSVVSAQNSVEVGDSDEEVTSFLRVTGGMKAKHRIVPSFVALQIFFDHGTRTCGGFLGPSADRIVTAANCVFEWENYSSFANLIFKNFLFSCSEGKTNKIKFAFGQSYNFKRNKIEFKDIYRVKNYDASKNTSADDLAVIILNSPVKLSRKVAVAIPSTQTAVNHYVGDNLFTCGFGDLDNHRNRTKKLRCTTLRVVPVAECSTIPIPGTICTKNVDGRNVCGGIVLWWT